jgi:hypothetical protein
VTPRAVALEGWGYGALAVALAGWIAVAPEPVDVPGSAVITTERDTAHVCAAATDAAVLTAERDTVQLGAPTVEPMAELTIERDTAHVCADESDQAVLEVERDTCELTWEAES